MPSTKAGKQKAKRAEGDAVVKILSASRRNLHCVAHRKPLAASRAGFLYAARHVSLLTEFHNQTETSCIYRRALCGADYLTLPGNIALRRQDGGRRDSGRQNLAGVLSGDAGQVMTRRQRAACLNKNARCPLSGGLRCSSWPMSCRCVSGSL